MSSGIFVALISTILLAMIAIDSFVKYRDLKEEYNKLEDIHFEYRHIKHRQIVDQYIELSRRRNELQRDYDELVEENMRLNDKLRACKIEDLQG